MKFAIDEGATINLGCRFNNTKFFKLGENSTINQFCHLDNRGGIYIGKNVSISPRVSIITADHDFDDEMCAARESPVVIEDYVFIGFGATVLRNTVLKIGSVVGAESLLTSSTDPYGIYFGIPAKLKKIRRKDLKHTSRYRRLFH
jgi:acetyltransferase-like isoleucine patch superfamily enzyme